MLHHIRQPPVLVRREKPATSLVPALFWTYANLLTLVLLAVSTGAAWQAGYRQFCIKRGRGGARGQPGASAAVININLSVASAQLNVNNGVFRATASGSITGPGSVNIGSGGAVVDSQAYSVALSSSAGGVGALTEIGAGTLTLSGANNYSGTTTVSNGTLLVNGSVYGAVDLESWSCSKITTTRLACTKGYPATRPGRKWAAQHLGQPALRISVGKAIAADCLNFQSPLEWQFAMDRIKRKIKTMLRQFYGLRDNDFLRLKLCALHESKPKLVG